MSKEIYLDHAATTPIHPKVAEAVLDIQKKGIYGNPSSIHGAGRASKKVVDDARQVIAESVGAKPSEIIFTSGGTESDNAAIFGTIMAKSSQGKHVITTLVEHDAVLKPMAHLEKIGYEVTYLTVDEQGLISLDEFKAALRPDTILVSIMTVNNEVGTIMPIAEIGELLKDHPAYFHTDAVQAYGIMDLNVQDLGVDLLSTSAHKINGPHGVGFLYSREGLKMSPYLYGGEQEFNRRAGTLNVAGIHGFKIAVELLKDGLEKKRKSLTDLKSYLLDEFVCRVRYEVNGSLDLAVPQIVNLSFPSQVADQLLIQLDLRKIFVSTGSACSAGNVQTSHVLEAMYGEDDPRLKSSLRLSFGYDTTKEEIDQFIETIESIINS